MRSSYWFLTVALLCGMAGRGTAQPDAQEIARLKKELANLQAENQRLKEELATLQEAETRPNVELYRPERGSGRDADKVIFSWKATGRSLSERPVSLYYAERVGAPWRLIERDLPREGPFAWRRWADVPAQVFLSLRVRDKAGKERKADTPEPVLIDFQPETKPLP